MAECREGPSATSLWVQASQRHPVHQASQVPDRLHLTSSAADMGLFPLVRAHRIQDTQPDCSGQDRLSNASSAVDTHGCCLTKRSLDPALCNG